MNFSRGCFYQVLLDGNPMFLELDYGDIFDRQYKKLDKDRLFYTQYNKPLDFCRGCCYQVTLDGNPMFLEAALVKQLPLWLRKLHKFNCNKAKK